MALTVELGSELEDRLQSEAENRGTDASGYLAQMVRSYLQAGGASQRPLFETLSPQEWQRVTQEWIDSHTDLPALSDFSMSREGIYGDHP